MNGKSCDKEITTAMFDEIDQETLNLIIEIQLQDAQNLIKGKHREGQQPDAELAMQLYCCELESLNTTCSDLAMSRSMAHAVLLDGDFISNHLEEEQQAVCDREYAISGQPSAAVLRTATPDAVIDDEMIRKLAALYVGVDDDRYSTVGEPSSRQTTEVGKSASVTETRRCLACMADVPFFETVQCPCSHEYCCSCIAELFKAAMGDESLFPPRCCSQPIPLGINQVFLPAELVGEYRAKELEYGTPNRTYCHQPACSTFIPLQFIQGDTATCIKCRGETCTICKSQSHDDHCPEDAATLEVLRIAEENGWQRCYSCHRVVDLSTGRNHISIPPHLFTCSNTRLTTR
ncbi:IBR domain-containing protein [Trichoderma velutinum]